MTRIAALVALCALSAGCERPWQVARTVVTATAEGVAAADTALVDAYEASDCEGQTDPARLRECVARLEEQTKAVRIAADSVRVGASVVDGWEQAGTAPAEWRDWLVVVGQGLARLTALVEAAGVPVPAELAHWASVLDDYLEGG